jgi:hypothetical protein
MTEESWFDSHHWQDFLFSNAFRPNLNPHPGSYSMGIGGPFSEVRWPECNVSHSSWSSGKVKNAWSCTSHLRNGTSLSIRTRLTLNMINIGTINYAKKKVYTKLVWLTLGVLYFFLLVYMLHRVPLRMRLFTFIRHCLSTEIVVVFKNFISQIREPQFLCKCDVIKLHFTISSITYHFVLSVLPFLSPDVRSSSVGSNFPQ